MQKEALHVCVLSYLVVDGFKDEERLPDLDNINTLMPD